MSAAGRFLGRLRLGAAFAKELAAYWRLLMRYNASCETEKDAEKSRFSLMREAHTLEKGMSLRSPRAGFGLAKAQRLMDGVESYLNHFGVSSTSFPAPVLEVLGAYLDYSGTSGFPLPELKVRHSALCARVKAAGGRQVPEEPQTGTKVPRAGTVTLSREAVIAASAGNFPSLAASRHSVRCFSHEPVERELLERALDIASCTPSACNRQAWRTRIFEGRRASQLLLWQGGCKGFETEVPVAILVTAELRAFLHYEAHQPYVDGGLYAMNLINALHSLGLGTIPVSCGFKFKKLRRLSAFGVPANEVPILIIGCGHMEPSFKVATSLRQPHETTNSYDL